MSRQDNTVFHDYPITIVVDAIATNFDCPRIYAAVAVIAISLIFSEFILIIICVERFGVLYIVFLIAAITIIAANERSGCYEQKTPEHYGQS